MTEMWGEAQRASELVETDPLAVALLQVTGPAHVSWQQDPVWQTVLTGWGVWVHVELDRDDNHKETQETTTGGVLQTACRSIRQHASQSSNLAALVLHLTRLLRECSRSKSTSNGNGTSTAAAASGEAFTQRLARVGQARALAGTLNLARILIHAVLDNPPHTTLDDDAFMYKSRDVQGVEQDVGGDLVQALLDFLQSSTDLQVPELYDATVLAMQLLLVLLSTPLYQPMQSSFQTNSSLQQQSAFWKHTFAYKHVRTLFKVWWTWQMHRPTPPAHSIQAQKALLMQHLADQNPWGAAKGADGLYESHTVVQAARPAPPDEPSKQESRAMQPTSSLSSSKLLLDATRGVLVLSTTIILLPLRLVRLAWGLIGQHHHHHHSHANPKKPARQHASRTRDVLWLSDSPLADLASSLLLLVTHHQRRAGGPKQNPYRDALVHLGDDRWDGVEAAAAQEEGLPDLPLEHVPLVSSPLSPTRSNNNKNALGLDFERLFSAFAATAHTEIGALLLYTVMQGSPDFGESVAVRSDLDQLALPLLRTLYLSSSSKFYGDVRNGNSSGGGVSSSNSSVASTQRRSSQASVGTVMTTAPLSIRNCPFRSQSQLYVLTILLLLFSQDASFGSDAFRRIHVPTLPWYKERHLRDISLGSVLVLVLLRALTFNLNRLHDAFLLSNCCAVLANLTPAMVDLHDYAAMRLVAVTISALKRTLHLLQQAPDQDTDDLTTIPSQHKEVARTLLAILKQCLSLKQLERNVHVVYALVYHQTDLKRLFGSKANPFSKADIGRIQAVTAAAAKIIAEDGDARTAPKALKVLSAHMERIRDAIPDGTKREDDFSFRYEEEADPEIFFVPYVWEVIVCTVTSSTIEWDKDRIKVFPLLDDVVEEEQDASGDAHSLAPVQEFSNDVLDVV